jgi:hypothetical protein
VREHAESQLVHVAQVLALEIAHRLGPHARDQGVDLFGHGVLSV